MVTEFWLPLRNTKQNPLGFDYLRGFCYARSMGVIYGLHLPGEPDNIRYVGKTTRRLAERLSGHRHAALTQMDSRPLSYWIRKHGRFGFEARVLAESDDWEQLSVLEIAAIERLGTHKDRGGLNVTLGGDGSLGLARTPDQREAQRQAILGRTYSQEHRDAIGRSHAGSIRGEVARRNMKAGATKRARTDAENSHIKNLSRKITDETVRAILVELRSGEFQRIIAERHNITQGRVSQIARQNGLGRRPGRL